MPPSSQQGSPFGGVNLSGLNLGGNAPQSQAFNFGDLAHNLTNIHSGSWAGLPDLGISEFLGVTPAYAAGPQQKQQYNNQQQQIQNTLNSNVLGSTDTGSVVPPPVTTTQGGNNGNGGNNGTKTTTTGGNGNTTDQVNGYAPTFGGQTVNGTDGNTYESRYDPSTGKLVWANVGSVTERQANAVKAQQEQANTLYAPVIQGLQDFISQHNPFATDSNSLAQKLTENVQNQGQNQLNLLPGQQQGMLNTIGQQEQNVGYQVQSALGDAIRAANALGQQALSRFGGGSSAGLAGTELAQQEFARQQGGINQQGIQSALQFGNNRLNVQNFIADKTSQINNWMGDAKTKITAQLQQEVDQANRDLSMTQAQREAMKMDALKDAQAFINQLDVLHQQNLNQIDLFHQALGGIGSQQINPNYLLPYMFNQPQTGSGLPQANTEAGFQANNNVGGGRTGQDQLMGLVGGGGLGGNNQNDQFGRQTATA